MSIRRRAVSILALVVLIVAPATALAGGRGHGKGHDGPSAHRSLRQAVTDQNFYFVMADRFANGDTANDNGGLPPGTGAGQSGFEPKVKGCYHGGDLKGLTSKIDYIQGLGTTAIWLTPSFKNKAVQPQDKSAGYHGYWITDFTQIDPHLGSNDGPAHARQRGPLARDQGLLRHHHQPHGRRNRLRPRPGRRPAAGIHLQGPGAYRTAAARRSTTATTPTAAPPSRRSRRTASRRARPPARSELPVQPVRAGRSRTSRSRPGSTT